MGLIDSISQNLPKYPATLNVIIAFEKGRCLEKDNFYGDPNDQYASIGGLTFIFGCFLYSKFISTH